MRRSVTAIVLIQLFCRSVAIRTNTAKRGQCILFLQDDIKGNYLQQQWAHIYFPPDVFVFSARPGLPELCGFIIITATL
jgi:hypothetical protein